MELAQLGYILPRRPVLDPSFSPARQHGSIGGEGESQLEADRRKTKERIEKLTDELAEVRRQRAAACRTPASSMADCFHCRIHQRREIDAAQRADRCGRAGGGQAVRDAGSDHAPPPAADEPERVTLGHGGIHPQAAARLVESFKATLEEVVEAELLLHVVDASHPHAENKFMR